MGCFAFANIIIPSPSSFNSCRWHRPRSRSLSLSLSLSLLYGLLLHWWRCRSLALSLSLSLSYGLLLHRALSLYYGVVFTIVTPSVTEIIIHDDGLRRTCCGGIESWDCWWCAAALFLLREFDQNHHLANWRTVSIVARFHDACGRSHLIGIGRTRSWHDGGVMFSGLKQQAWGR